MKKLRAGKKKGSAIVEAALIFPLVILTIMALISMMVFFYQQTAVRADMHMALRAESGKATGTVFYRTAADAPFAIYRHNGQMRCAGTMMFRGKGLLWPTGRQLASRKYMVDEVQVIRYTDLWKTGMKVHEQ